MPYDNLMVRIELYRAPSSVGRWYDIALYWLLRKVWDRRLVLRMVGKATDQLRYEVPFGCPVRGNGLWLSGIVYIPLVDIEEPSDIAEESDDQKIR